MILRNIINILINTKDFINKAYFWNPVRYALSLLKDWLMLRKITKYLVNLYNLKLIV